MTNREKLIEFIKAKNNIIEKAIRVKYIDHVDIKNVKKWNDMECKDTYYKLFNYIKNKKAGGISEYTCIWCLRNTWSNYTDCRVCAYGKRHGRCCESDSLYAKYSGITVQREFSNKVYVGIIDNIEKGELT